MRAFTRNPARILSVFIVLVAALPLQAATNPLDAVSQKAAVVIRLKQPEKTIQRAVDLLNQLQPGLGGLLQAQANKIGVLISNPTLAGADKQNDWYVAAFPRKEGQPGVLFAIPATDVSEFQNALGDLFHSFAKDKIVFYSDDADTVQQAKDCLKNAAGGVTSVMDPHSRQLFDAGDLSVFVNVSVLKDIYSERLQELKKRAADGLQRLESQLAEQQQPRQAEAVTGILQELVATAWQVLDDSESFTSAATVGKDGLVTECYLHVKPDSPTDRFLEASPPQELKMLTLLPSGKLAYLGARFDQREIIRWAAKFLGILRSARLGEAGSQEDAEAAKELEEAVKQLGELRIGEMVGYFELGDLSSGLIRTGGVTEVDQPQKWLDAYLQVYRLSTMLDGVPWMHARVEVQRDAEKYGQYSGTIVKSRVEYDESEPAAAMAKKVTDALYGPGGATLRLVSTKDKVYMTFGGSKQDMVSLLAAFEQKRPQEEKQNKLRKEESKPLTGPAGQHIAVLQKHFAKANLVGLIDLPNLVLKAAKQLVEGGVLPLRIDPQMLSGMTIEPSYTAAGLATEKDGLTLKLAIPAEQFRGISQLVTFAQQIFLQYQLQQMQQEEQEPVFPR